MTGDLTAAARLFDVANQDDVVIDELEQVLDTLKDARRAKQELACLPPSDLRRILTLRAQGRTSS